MGVNISHGKLEKGKTIVNCAQTMILKSRRHEKALQVSIFFYESACYAGHNEDYDKEKRPKLLSFK